MEPSIKDNGWEIKSMGMEFKYGLMELVMRDIGKITKHVEKENFGM
jgi:hypothetical protein